MKLQVYLNIATVALSDLRTLTHTLLIDVAWLYEANGRKIFELQYPP